MLRYLNTGLRRFGDIPMPPHVRLLWDFYAVIEGKCGLMLKDETKLPLHESRLWILPPGHFHGWYGVPGKHCRIVCFQFESVAAPLEEVVRALGWFERPLSLSDCTMLEAMVHAAERDFHHPTTLAPIRFQRLLCDLTLLALADAGDAELPTHSQKARAKVDAAIGWYRQNIRRAPDFSQVASAVHVSQSHLRRLFMQAMKTSPSEAFTRMAMEEAFFRLSNSDLKIEAVAAESGFKSASDFCRVFKARVGCTPSEWRRRLPVEQASAALTKPVAPAMPPPHHRSKTSRGSLVPGK